MILVASCLLLRPVFELLPGLAAQLFERGAEGLSALASATGLGAVLGGFWLGQRRSVKGLALVVICNTLLMALALLCLALTQQFWQALLCLGLAGATTTLSGAGSQTLIQTAVDGAMRGRVMSLYGMIIRAGPACGALLMGVLADYSGFRLPLMLGCALFLLGGIWMLRRLPELRKALEVSHPNRPVE